MQLIHRPVARVLIGLTAALTTACDDSTGPAPAPTGAIDISVSTISTLAEIDPDGYTLRVNADFPRAISVNGTVRIGALRRGRHSVRLDGLATNCAIAGSNPRVVEVTADGAVATAAFEVSCSATGGRGDWDY